MKIDKFEKLAIEIEEGTYEQQYSSIERTLFFSSFLGNAASIIFAFFFVNNIVGTIHQYVKGQEYIMPAIIVVFLTCYEFLKRFIFRRLTVNVLTGKSRFTIKNLIGLLFTGLLIAGSFYMSVNGAKQVVDNTKVIQQTSDSTIVTEKNTIDSTYNAEIKALNNKIKFCYDNAAKRESKWGLSRSEKEDTRRWEADVKSLKVEKEQKLAEIKNDVVIKADNKLVEVKSNVFTFFLLSTLIEVLILIGVGFNAYYWFHSYNEYKLKITRNPNYKKFKIFDYLLIVLYQNGAKVIDDEVPNVEDFVKLVKVHDCDASEKDSENFMLMAFQLGIVKQPNDKIKINVTYETALTRVKQYLIIN